MSEPIPAPVPTPPPAPPTPPPHPQPHVPVEPSKFTATAPGHGLELDMHVALDTSAGTIRGIVTEVDGDTFSVTPYADLGLLATAAGISLPPLGLRAAAEPTRPVPNRAMKRRAARAARRPLLVGAVALASVLMAACGAAADTVTPQPTVISPPAEQIHHDGWYDTLTWCSHGTRVFQDGNGGETHYVPADPSCAS